MKSQYELLQQKRHKKVTVAAQWLELEDFLQYVMSTNPSSNSPYHNNQHLYTVAINVVDAAVYYHLDDITKKMLLAAALFHDYDHTCGKEDDFVNIQRAVNHFQEKNAQHNWFTDEESTNIIHLIQSTEFPHKKSSTDTLEQNILRDADLIQVLEDDAELWIQGLFEEQGLETTYDESIYFMLSHVETEWGKKKILGIETRYHIP